MVSGAWLPILTAPCRGNFEPRWLRKTCRRRYRVSRLVDAPLLLLWECSRNWQPFSRRHEAGRRAAGPNLPRSLCQSFELAFVRHAFRDDEKQGGIAVHVDGFAPSEVGGGKCAGNTGRA